MVLKWGVRDKRGDSRGKYWGMCPKEGWKNYFQVSLCWVHTSWGREKIGYGKRICEKGGIKMVWLKKLDNQTQTGGGNLWDTFGDETTLEVYMVGGTKNNIMFVSFSYFWAAETNQREKTTER